MGTSYAMRRELIVSLGSLIAVAGEGCKVVRDRPAQMRRDKTKKKKLEIGIVIPTREEVSQLLKSVRGRFRPFLIAAASTGMRASELHGLCAGVTSISTRPRYTSDREQIVTANSMLRSQTRALARYRSAHL